MQQDIVTPIRWSRSLEPILRWVVLTSLLFSLPAPSEHEHTLKAPAWTSTQSKDLCAAPATPRSTSRPEQESMPPPPPPLPTFAQQSSPPPAPSSAPPSSSLPTHACGIKLSVAPGTVSGYEGVTPSTSRPGAFVATCRVEVCGFSQYLGTFDSALEAAICYAKVVRARRALDAKASEAAVNLYTAMHAPRRRTSPKPKTQPPRPTSMTPSGCPEPGHRLAAFIRPSRAHSPPPELTPELAPGIAAHAPPETLPAEMLPHPAPPRSPSSAPPLPRASPPPAAWSPPPPLPPTHVPPYISVSSLSPEQPRSAALLPSPTPPRARSPPPMPPPPMPPPKQTSELRRCASLRRYAHHRKVHHRPARDQPPLCSPA